MTEQHEWKPCNTGENGCGGWVCRFHSLEPSLQTILNEYETLKKATEALSAEQAGKAWALIVTRDEVLKFGPLTDEARAIKDGLKAYADILEEK